MTIRRAFVILSLAQLFSMGVRATLDPDMWWHLRTGEAIWNDGIPRHDIFSFTVLTTSGLHMSGYRMSSCGESTNRSACRG